MSLTIARPDRPGVVAHRGASAELAEHTLAAYELALDQGADAVECDVRLTRDHQLVCIHDRTVDRTSSGTGVVSEMSLAELSELDFGSWHPSGTSSPVLTLRELLTLVLDWERPIRLFIETKHPVRYGALVEQFLLAELARFGIASPRSADLSRAVVISFSAASVWRVRRNAPLLPTVLLGETSRVLGGSAATAVGATGIGPSIASLREHPDLVDRAAASGRVTYCWTVNEHEQLDLCLETGVGWVATDYPMRVRAWLGGPDAASV
ncbi:glycerophosphodiester phosphodiesterase [Gordonia jinhuaensis]|uniref:Glycerophosphoryl diester phosphodiesterase n=1 Tax=Gordonia jinhuaensis TaxID=1517702 RepID=A0A916WYA8_9ACTN|nr:glycerophosphodiester phosphodiesterase [Gordonia jinhuaensis]GGB43263.1 putative glycerophosphoryl diester phosphodiesterase [Gordonia jinhuaensis]